jgi:hypothetical protein
LVLLLELTHLLTASIADFGCFRLLLQLLLPPVQVEDVHGWNATDFGALVVDLEHVVLINTLHRCEIVTTAEVVEVLVDLLFDSLVADRFSCSLVGVVCAQL